MPSQKDPKQLAIEKTKGPCLLKAGAGTGKTYTIVKKIAHMVNENIYKPKEILCLTFSNEATNHLREEVSKEIKNSSDITIRTFHGFCSDILKELGSKIGINSDFEVLQPDDAKVLMHKYLGVRPFDSNRYVTTISTAKDLGISMEQIEKYAESLKSSFKGIADIDEYAKEMDFKLKTLHLRADNTREEKKEIKKFIDDYEEYVKYRSFIEAWKKYDQLKKEKNYQDYSDLNFNVLKVFNAYGADEISKKYKYVIVDEFQDTNKLQFDLIEYLARELEGITAVGDQNQSIYAFRGSFGEVFSYFEERFKLKKEDIFNLEKSRRSPNRILRIAYQLIKNNYENPKDCIKIEHYENKEGEKVKVIDLKNGEEEARKIAEIVEKEIEDGTPLNEICVLHRTHAQSKLIEQALESKNIPVVSAGQTDLMNKPEIRTVISYLSVLNNLLERTGTGEQAWWSLFHYKNALSSADSIKIGRYLKEAKKDNMSIDYAAIVNLEKLDLSEHGKEIIKRITDKLEEIIKSSNQPLPELILDIYELTGLSRQFTYDRTPRNVEGLMNLKEFYNIALKYCTLHEKSLSSFINYLEILENVGVDIPASKIKDINAVRLMTIHAVKGLEFDKVIVSNLSERRFPIERTRNEPLIPKFLNPDIKIYLEKNKLEEDDEEAIKEYEKKSLMLEERRLCYVAFTRAKKELILTFARSYNGEEDSTQASIFLNEIEYDKNPDISLIKDDEEKCTIFAPCSMYDQHKDLLKKQLVESLEIDNFETILSRLLTYYSVREGEIKDYKVDINKLIDKNQLESNINKHKKKISSLKFDKSNFTFSPTALETYDECPKRYELQNIFQMPQRGAFEWSGASTGSFVHELLETGVRELYTKKEEFIKEAEKMSHQEEWKGVNLKDVNGLIDVFWERHKGRYNKDSQVEKWLEVELGGFRFNGKVDRIDVIKGKDVEIIDYKTDKDAIEPKKRSWQLGFYAIAVKNALGLNPIKLTLEMLRLEKPLEGEVDKNGDVKSGRSKGFNIKEVEQQLIEAAKNIMKDYEGEFLPTEDENKCRFCRYKFYCPRWEEK